MKHETDIQYKGGYKKLAEDLGNLKYDSLCEFLQRLSYKIKKDSLADSDRQRLKLAGELSEAANHMRNAWIICQPYMHESQEKVKQGFINGPN